MACTIRSPYTNIVLAVPHAEWKPACVDWTKDANVSRECNRWTDWFTDELFASDEVGVMLVRGSVSRLDCDLERLEGEEDRLCKYRMYMNGSDNKSVPLMNRMLAEWFRYRADVMTAASVGEYPLIIDCHSFPADLAPDVDICIGYNNDDSRPHQDTLDALAECFRSAGFSVAFNVPYSNALAPVGYCGHSLMIEVNKRCYLNARNQEGARYEKLHTGLKKIYKLLLGREGINSCDHVIQ